MRNLIACHLVVVLFVLAACASNPVKSPTGVANPYMRASDFQPPGYAVRRPNRAQRLLVVVHGLTGDGVSTWTSPSGTYWPKLIEAEPVLSDFNVYVYDYPTKYFGDCMSVTDLANDLRLRLVDAGAFTNYSQVVFLAHSMGGLIVRQFLLRNRDDLAKQVPLVLFFATPTAGAESANLASRLTTCSQVDDLRTLDRNAYLQSQQSDWISSPLSKSIFSYCAFEILSPTVPRGSASLLCSNDPVPLNTNHSDAVKPESSESAPHIALRSAVRDYLTARSSPPTVPPPRLGSDILFVDCQIGLMPALVPPEGGIHVWVTADLPSESGRGGLANYFGRPGSEWKWNNTGVPQWVYRCEITNYATQVALNIQMDWHVTFYEPLAVPDQPNSFRQGKVTVDRDWRVSIPKIDVGPDKRFVFYVWNCCVERFVRVSVPSKATVEFPGVVARKEMSVTQSSGNLFQSLSPHPWPPPARF
jgi:pimeloyl-ACP methyl ester carboxylesterase